MIINNLNKKIRIEKRSKSVNQIGTPNSETYTLLRNTYAGVVYNSGSKLTNDAGEFPVYSIDFTVRYRDDYDYTCRIIYEGQTYIIDDIQIIGNKEGIRFKTSKYGN